MGMLRLLNETYIQGQRHASKLAGLKAAYWWELLKPLMWGKLLMAYAKGGQSAFVVAAAHSVDWKRHLSPKCITPRGKDDILSKTKSAAVCWNFVEDFHDLYCDFSTGLD